MHGWHAERATILTMHPHLLSVFAITQPGLEQALLALESDEPAINPSNPGRTTESAEKAILIMYL